eukprot:3411-Heterococcus_DN1.PRE.3
MHACMHARNREAFRVHAGSPDRQPWPSTALQSAWMTLLQLCERICDRALSITLGYTLAHNAKNLRSDTYTTAVCVEVASSTAVVVIQIYSTA